MTCCIGRPVASLSALSRMLSPTPDHVEKERKREREREKERKRERDRETERDRERQREMSKLKSA